MPGRSPSAKTQFNQRLHRERRWDEYLLRREALKKEGVSDRDAWKVAGVEFPPLDGSPLEFEAQGGPQSAAPDRSVSESIKAYDQQHTQSAGARSPAIAGEFAELVTKIDRAKASSELDIMRWVLKHLLVSPAEMDPEEVPGLAAISVLKWVKSSGANMSEFMRIWAKIIPTKSELEVQDRFRDNGQRQFALLDQFDGEDEDVEVPA